MLEKAIKALQQLQKWPTIIPLSLRPGMTVATRPMGTVTPTLQMCGLGTRGEADSKVELAEVAEVEAVGGEAKVGVIAKALEAMIGVDVTRRRTWDVENTSMYYLNTYN